MLLIVAFKTAWTAGEHWSTLLRTRIQFDVSGFNGPAPVDFLREQTAAPCVLSVWQEVFTNRHWLNWFSLCKKDGRCVSISLPPYKTRLNYLGDGGRHLVPASSLGVSMEFPPTHREGDLWPEITEGEGFMGCSPPPGGQSRLQCSPLGCRHMTPTWTLDHDVVQVKRLTASSSLLPRPHPSVCRLFVFVIISLISGFL